MSKYTAGVPNGAKSFTHNGVKYNAGDKFETDDPCEVMAFASEFKGENPDSGKVDKTPDFWKSAAAACAAAAVPAPADTPPDVPDESQPGANEGGDTAAKQGAPAPKGPGAEGSEKPDTPADTPPAPGDEPKRPPKGEVNPKLATEAPKVRTDAGEPVDIFTGAFYIDETDLEVPNTILPLVLKRSYRSGTPVFGPFGWNWDHNYNLYVRELNDGNIALWRSLREDVFRFDGAGFEPPRGVFEKLERVTALAQTYEITGEGGTLMRFERPPGWADGERIPVLRLQDRHGNALRFSYGAEDRLAEVRDDDDRFLHFDYDSCGLLAAVSDAAGRVYTYEHDEQRMQLVRADTPATADHPHGISRLYYYSDAYAPLELRQNIVRVEDAEGNVYLENAYDEDPASLYFARVTEQLYGDYLFQYRYTQLQSVPADPVFINIGAMQVEVMNPDFGLETYTFNYRGDLLDRRYRLNKDGSFRIVAIQYEYDAQGNLATTTRPDGSAELNVYDALNPDPRLRGKLLRKELTAAAGFPAPSRIIWRGGYEPVHQLLVEERNEANAVTRYDYDFDLTPAAPDNTGKLKRIRHPDATLPDGTVQAAVTRFEHNAKGQTTAVILPHGGRNEMTYGNAGAARSRLVMQAFDVGGLNIQNRIEYDAAGYDVVAIDGNGNATTKAVNALGQMEKETRPAILGVSGEQIFHYNADRKLSAFERPRGDYTEPGLAGEKIVDRFDRDVLGYPVKIVMGENTSQARTFTSTFDFRGFATRTVTPDGAQIKRVYDERGRVVKESIAGVDGATLSTRVAHDRTGNVVQVIGADGLVTRYAYDGFARLVKVTRPNGTEIRNTWRAGDLLAATETVGDDGTGAARTLSKTSYAYDERYRLVQETVDSFVDDPTTAVAVTTRYFHDAGNRIERIVDTRGGIRRFRYDGLGRLTAQVDPMGNEERYGYDANSNLIRIERHHKEPDGSISIIAKSYGYDARNRQINVTEPDGSGIQLEYDNADRLVRQTDAFGRIKTVSYDAHAQRVEETYDAGGLTIRHRWQLDVMSRPVRYIDPTGETSSYAYDGVGRMVMSQYPNGVTSTRVFDNAGRLAREQMASGVAFDYAYDAGGRLAQIVNTATPAAIDAVAPHGFQYDGLDRIVRASMGADQIVRAYDSRGRLVRETSGGAALRQSYDDPSGDRTRVWPDGRTEKHSHDLNGTVTRIEETAHGALGAGLNLIATHVPSGDAYFGEANYPGNVKVSGRYDDRKRLVDLVASMPGGADEGVRYRYDAANRRRVEALLGASARLSYFEFDAKYRLASAKSGFALALPAAVQQGEHDAAVAAAAAAAAGAAATETFSYDPADARLNATRTGEASRTYTYLPGHRIQSDGIDTFTHTPEGVLSGDGHFTYRADALGRISSVHSGAATVCSLAYDALGRPSVIREQGRPDRGLHYFGNFVAQESEAGVAVRHRTVHSTTGMPIAYHANAATHLTLFDGRYNLIGLVDASGALVESYRYRPFGMPSIFDAAGNPLASSQFGVEPVFGGQRYLPSIGLYLSAKRLMNPVHGLFLSPDPEGYINSASLYVYAAQNPIDLIDPEGDFAFLALLAVMAVGALVAGGLNAARQGIQMAEDPRKRAEGFSWSELGISMGLGAVLAPVLVFAPEIGIPLAGYGVANGVSQMSQGNYMTGTFDIVTSLAPFGSKTVRNSTFGPGSVVGQARGLGPSAPLSARGGRFTLIENNLDNFAPSPFGKEIGLGFSKAQNSPEGHVAVILEKEGGGFWFVEKNAQRAPDRSLVALFNEADNPPDIYFGLPERPFEYSSIRVPKSSVDQAMSYAKGRIPDTGLEPFDFKSANCSHFAGDVLNAGGFKGMGNGRASGLYNDFTNFNAATKSTYASPFWAKAPVSSSPPKK
jgi:RHS repeat-associated protein